MAKAAGLLFIWKDAGFSPPRSPINKGSCNLAARSCASRSELTGKQRRPWDAAVIAVVVARITSIATAAQPGPKLRRPGKQSITTFLIIRFGVLGSRSFEAEPVASSVLQTHRNEVRAGRSRLGAVPQCEHYRGALQAQNGRGARTGSAYWVPRT